MNVIFLDIDGVLNSMPSQDQEDEEISSVYLKNLQKLVIDCDAKIVLSSSWRVAENVEGIDVTMYKYLLKRLADFGLELFDSTPWLEMRRPFEIYTWLKDHSSIPDLHYVILDDDYHAEHYTKYGIEDHLVQTYYFCTTVEEGGLSDRKVEEAKQVLKL